MYRPTPQQESPYESARRLNNLAQSGTISAVRLEHPARVRVRVGDNETGWLPWLAGRAGGLSGGRSWWPPVVGEQCLVISPGGDYNQGVCLLGAYSDAMAQGSDRALQSLQELGQASIEMLEESITLRVGTASITIENGAITMSSGAGVTLSITDRVYANPDLIAGGRISSVHHTHPGVRRGNANTDPPQ